MWTDLASRLEKRMRVAGSMEEARYLLIPLITYISENTPSELKLVCLLLAPLPCKQEPWLA